MLFALIITPNVLGAYFLNDTFDTPNKGYNVGVWSSTGFFQNNVTKYSGNSSVGGGNGAYLESLNSTFRGNATYAVFAYFDGATGTGNTGLGINQTTGVHLGFKNNGAQYWYGSATDGAYSSYNLVLNQWIELAVYVVGNGSAHWYVNGTFVGSTFNTGRTGGLLRLGNPSGTISFNNYYDSYLAWEGNYTNRPQGALSPTLTFNSPTPASGTKQFITNRNLELYTSTLNMNGTINITQRVYSDGNQLLYLRSNITNSSFNNFTNLPAGTYYFNATATNGVLNATTETRTFTIYNITTGTITNPTLNQNISEFLNTSWTNSSTTNNSVNINAFKINLLNSDSSFNRTLQSLNNASLSFNNINMYNQNLSVGQYYVQVEVNDTNNNKANYSNILFNYVSNAKLNITALNYTGGSVSSFNLSVLELNTSTLTNYPSVAGKVVIDAIKYYQYQILLNASNYALGRANITSTSNAQTYQFTLYPYNALNISLRQESDGSIVYGNTSLAFIGDLGSSLSTNMNGTKLITGFQADTYSLTAIYSSYVRTGRITIPEGSYQEYSIYINNGTNVLFNFISVSGTTLDGVELNVYAYINGVLTLVETAISDSTGRAQVHLEANKYYYFSASKSGYNSYPFDYPQILFSSYDVTMTSSSSGSDVEPSAQVIYSPSSFARFQYVNFRTEFISTHNNLVSYSYILTTPSGSFNGSGTTSGGQLFNNSFNLINVSLNEYVTLYYEYTLNNGVYFNNTLRFPIVYTYSNRTWNSMGTNINASTGQDSITGWFIGERVLIVAFIMVIMFGVGFVFAGAGAGLIFSLIPLLFFLRAGFVPKEIYYVTIFFIVIYFISKGSDS